MSKITFCLLCVFCGLALAACDSSSDYAYTPAYEPPTINPSQAATVAESYVSLQLTQQAAEAQLAADAADVSATGTAVAGLIELERFHDEQTTVAKTAAFQGTQWAATMTQDATNSAGALQLTNIAGTQAQSAANLQIVRDEEEAEALRLETERQAMVNTFSAWAARLFLFVLSVCAAVIVLYLVWRIGRANARKKENQSQLQATGPNGANTTATVNTEKGVVVYNPAAAPGMIISRDGTVTPFAAFSAEDQLASIIANLYVLYQQAQHNPFPPVKEKPPVETNNRWKLPFGFEHETRATPVIPPAPFSMPPRPTLPASQPQAALAQPPAEVVDADIVILPPDHPDVSPIVEEVEAKLLTNGGQS